MKTILLSLIAPLLIIPSTPEVPDKYEILTLINAIPDHEIKVGTEKYFTERYYALLEHAWDIPSDAIGGIGSEDWLYYFITGNDMPYNVPAPKILKVVPTQYGADVLFCYLDENHRMNLTYENGRWVIADYDNTLSKLKEYINKQRIYFKSNEWKKYLDDTRKNFDAEAADLAEKEVEEYFLKYKYFTFQIEKPSLQQSLPDDLRQRSPSDLF